MNLKYLGDALDHWKGAIFDGLQSGNVLRDFAVDAMASDASAWGSDDWSLFSRLLRIRSTQVILHANELAANRTDYFKEIRHQGDLFLDADTGIATGRVDDPSQYLMPRELLDLLESADSRIVAVYQHVRAKKTRNRLEEVIVVIRRHDSPFSCGSYESGTVAMLFFSRREGRVRGVTGYFQSVLGRHAPGRVNVW